MSSRKKLVRNSQKVFIYERGNPGYCNLFYNLSLCLKKVMVDYNFTVVLIPEWEFSQQYAQRVFIR